MPIFPVYGSLLVIDDGTPCAYPKAQRMLKVLDIGGEWEIGEKTLNSLTLDKCSYWFDGELQEENAYVLDILPRACDLLRPVDLVCEFKANIEKLSESLYLACETPDIFDIKVNGAVIDKTDCGHFRDSSFRMIDIRKYAKLGPHRLGEGESYHVSPASFYRRACVWNGFCENTSFREGYCLVKTGLI